MANIFTNSPALLDFEEGDLSDVDAIVTASTGSVSASSTQAYAGSYSCYTETDNFSPDFYAVAWFGKLITWPTNNTAYARLFVYIEDKGAGEYGMIGPLFGFCRDYYDLVNYSWLRFMLRADGSLWVFVRTGDGYQEGNDNIDTGVDLSTGQWYEIEFLYDLSGTDAHAALWINGASSPAWDYTATGDGKPSNGADRLVCGIRNLHISQYEQWAKLYYDSVEAADARIGGGAAELNVTADESAVLSENALALLGDMGMVIEDSMAVSDAPASSLGIEVVAGEGVGVGEAVASAIESLALAASEGAATGESLGAALSALTISVQDAATAGEAVTITVLEAGLLGISVSEAVAISEATSSLLGDLGLDVADAATIGEAIGEALALWAGRLEEVTLGEALQASVSALAALGEDSANVAEAVAGHLVDLGLGVDDAAALAEAVASLIYEPGATREMVVGDTAALAEAIIVQLSTAAALSIAATEAVTLAEAVSAAVVLALVYPLRAVYANDGVSRAVYANDGASRATYEEVW